MAGRQTEERCHGLYTVSAAVPWRWQPAKGRVYSSYHQGCALSSGKDVCPWRNNDFLLHRQDPNLVTVGSCSGHCEFPQSHNVSRTLSDMSPRKPGTFLKGKCILHEAASPNFIEEPGFFLLLLLFFRRTF